MPGGRQIDPNVCAGIQRGTSVNIGRDGEMLGAKTANGIKNGHNGMIHAMLRQFSDNLVRPMMETSNAQTYIQKTGADMPSGGKARAGTNCWKLHMTICNGGPR